MARSSFEVVVKITKYCNLRCRYCYEYNELHQKERMELAQIERMFRNLLPYAREHGLDHLRFCWHGGEPFLIPLSYYREIARIQHDVFGETIPCWNTVQTNLTVLTDQHLAFLSNKEFFAGIGVSYDVVGGERVDATGKTKDDVVAGNLETLAGTDIQYGGITVLSKSTLPHVESIYDFYDRRRIRFRFLPFYLSANADQPARHAISYAELVDALKRVFLKWATSETATSVDPIEEYVEAAMRYISGAEPYRYNKWDDEFVLVANRDGSVWGQGEAYAGICYGNLFEQDVGAVLTSPGRRRAIARAEERLATYCGPCPYYGSCAGHFVGEATALQERMLAESGCPVRPVLEFMIGFLKRAGLDRPEDMEALPPEASPMYAAAPLASG
jgi:uncharacterized protein